MIIKPKQYCTIDFTVINNKPLGGNMNLLILETDRPLPDIQPGQFVNVLVPSYEVMLRRPISVCDFNPREGRLFLLVKNLGRGSAAICKAPKGSLLNLLLPLGNGFTIHKSNREKILLVGGGVGMAPLYYLAGVMQEQGKAPTVLLGARTLTDIALRNYFRRTCRLFMITEDGSPNSTKGLVTDHTLLQPDAVKRFRRIYCCGPLPMMKAVADIARRAGVWCEVSLENKMACGVGACLCCVENTVTGHKCACTDGPVFNIDTLTW